MSSKERGSLEKLILAGIGAMAITHEKSKELINEFVKKGELTVEQGKSLNEELTHHVKEKISDEVIKPVESFAFTGLVKNLERLSDDERNVLKEKLQEIEKAGENDDVNVGE